MRLRRAVGVKYFRVTEKQAFLQAVQAEGNIRDRVMINLFLATGLRVSELSGLTIGQVSGRTVITVTGKGNKSREIPLLPAIQAELAGFIAWKQDHRESVHPYAPLFCAGQSGKRLSTRAIQHRVKHYCARANLGRTLSPHAFRHTVGYTLGKAGEPIQVIQTLLGHSNLNTTRIYVEPDIEQIQASMVRALG